MTVVLESRIQYKGQAGDCVMLTVCYVDSTLC